jgi:hypothetical protein
MRNGLAAIVILLAMAHASGVAADDADGSIRPGVVQKLQIPPRLPVYPDFMTSVPEQVLAASRKHNCSVPSRRPNGEHGPPAWVFSFPTLKGFIAYCRYSQPAGEENYDAWGLLLAIPQENDPWVGCPRFVAADLAQPALDLQVLSLPHPRSSSPPLDDYWFIEDRSPVVPPDSRPAQNPPEGLAIQLDIGAAGNILHCTAGRWIMAGYH